MGKGSNTTQTNSNSSSSMSPDSNAYQAYLALLDRSKGVANTPYQGYSGEEVAPINAQQTAGIGTINDATTRAMQPLSSAAINQYMNPETDAVIGATQRDFDVQNKRADSTVLGNAASQGALGGDRSAVAQALMQEQQGRTQAPVIAGMRSKAYDDAVRTASDQQKFGLQAGLQGGQAQVGVGSLQQQTQQAQDTQGRQDYYQKQGYPFQVAQWLAAIDTGVGSQMGGTSDSTGRAVTEGPKPNPWSQIAGVGLTAAGIFAKDGGRVEERPGFAGGGMPAMPWSEGPSWVPQVGGLTAGRGAPPPSALPQPPSMKEQSSGLSKDQMKGVGAIGKGASGLDWGGGWGAGVGNLSGDSWGGGSFLKGDSYGGSAASPLSGLSADDYGAARGGRVRRYANGGYADGGYPDEEFDDRFGAAFPNRTVAGVGASRPAYEVNDEDRERGHDMLRMGMGPPPIRMLDQPADGSDPMTPWRRSVDRDRGMGVTAQPKSLEPTELPPEVEMGRSKRPAEDAGEGSTALGYGSSPRLLRGSPSPSGAGDDTLSGGAGNDKMGAPPDEGFLSGLGIKMTPELRSGLLQAGLSMMANRHGGSGSFLSNLGEAGVHGVAAHNATITAAQEQAKQLRKEQFERQKFDRPYSELTAAEKVQERRAAEERAEKRATSPLIKGPDGSYIVNPAWVKMKTQEAEITQKDKFAPIGNVVTESGAVHPLVMNQADGTVIDSVTRKPPADTDRVTGKAGPGMSDQALQSMVKEYRAGNTGVLAGIGRGTQGPENLQRFWEQMSTDLRREGATGGELAAARANFQAQTAALKSQAVREANVQSSINEAEKTFPLLEKASENLPRTNYPKINQAIEAWRKGNGSPEQRAYGAAIQGAITAYSQAMSKNGGNTVHAQQHAEALFEKADGHDAIKATTAQLRLEMKAARDAPAETRDQILKEILSGGKPSGSHSKPEKTLSATDQQAMDWANANPKDPRAAEIKKRLGVQ